MGKSDQRFVAKAEAGKGWRVWDRKMKKWWGQWRTSCPTDVVNELNGEKRPDKLVELTRTK